MELGNLIFGNSRGTYPVPRGWTEDLFLKFLKEVGCNQDGYITLKNVNSNIRFNKWGGISNETFEINPYNWDLFQVETPANFIYYPENFEIRWYKYPLRDAYSNQEFDYDRLKTILNHCVETVKKKG